MSALPSLPAECNELITLADRNAERLLKLINDILDVERISLGKLELKMKPCNLQEIVQEAIRISHPLAIENQIELIEDHLIDNTFVEADYDRLLQVILNLISNSIKFSSANASVILNMELQDKYVRLLVRDSGQGIPYEIQGKIFEKFVQADTGDTKTKGTGLGLNISKNFIEQMGGKIGFVSEPGKGALFFIDLPLMKKKD
jgi:signal transduction histidine kinase